MICYHFLFTIETQRVLIFLNSLISCLQIKKTMIFIRLDCIKGTFAGSGETDTGEGATFTG